MILAAAPTAVFVSAPLRRSARVAAYAEPRAWSLQVVAWLRQGAQLCVAARTPAALAAMAPRYGARPAPSLPRRTAWSATPTWLLGPRGEVTVSAAAAPGGLRCTVAAASGEAAALQRDLPGLAQGLGFTRMATMPARWAGEGAWRGGGAAAGLELFSAAPLVHGAPYGALLQFAPRLP